MQTEDGTDKELAEVNQLRDTLRGLGYLGHVQRAQQSYEFVVSFTFGGVFSSDRALLDHLFARLDHVIAPSKLLHDGFCEKKPTWEASKGDDGYVIQEGGFGTTTTAPETSTDVGTLGTDTVAGIASGKSAERK